MFCLDSWSAVLKVAVCKCYISNSKLCPKFHLQSSFELCLFLMEFAQAPKLIVHTSLFTPNTTMGCNVEVEQRDIQTIKIVRLIQKYSS
jgi:hypothetical protein